MTSKKNREPNCNYAEYMRQMKILKSTECAIRITLKMPG